MKYLIHRLCTGLLLALVFITASAEAETSQQSSYKKVEWDDLLPKEDLEALSNPPDFLSEIEDGSPEDQVTFTIQRTPKDEQERLAALNFQEALVSTRIIEKLDGEAIKIPGFIVPLEYNDDQVITEFFLVPYFGACIHVPPPPPNQIIYVKYPKGFQLPALYDPFYISGTLKTELVKNDLGTSAYSMIADGLEPYTE